MGVTEDLERLATLHKDGILTDEEFAAAKRRALSSQDAAEAPKASGQAVSRPAKKGGTPVFWPLAGIGVVVVGLLLANVANSPGAKQRQKERAAIDLCWQDYERKSLDPSTKRFVASTCEMMEDEYRRTHGREP